MAGYRLTGLTTEHAPFIPCGTGANGKSVFAITLTAFLGDCATVAPMDMFMATQGDRHTGGGSGGHCSGRRYPDPPREGREPGVGRLRLAAEPSETARSGLADIFQPGAHLSTA